jgi:uncharacterized protein YegP (UPF0339 family)
MTHRFIVYRDSKGEWRWRLRRYKGGKIIADSGEGYATERNAYAAVARMKKIVWSKVYTQ